ncbi:MAG: DUF3007 family protein [Cyanobacteria bacterium J083]|nr:MAG: DUF3007 family protein [Cyanobacteria bacterium J083]
MRRIDAITICLAVFIAGGLAYLTLKLLGLKSDSAGVWSQAILVIGLLAWLGTYLFRVGTKNMSYNQQLKNYEDAVLEKRLAEMTPEEIAQLQKEVEKEKKTQG